MVLRHLARLYPPIGAARGYGGAFHFGPHAAYHRCAPSARPPTVAKRPGGRSPSLHPHERELPSTVVFGGSLAMILIVWAVLAFKINPGSAETSWHPPGGGFQFPFRHRVGTHRGLIGASANPISGMTIAP